MRNEQSVALALCPRWGTSGPPISLAYLAGALRKRGHAVAAFDLNVEFVAEHRAFLERQETDADLWGYPEKYRTLIEPLMYPYLRKWADRILRAEPAAVCFSTYWSNRYPTHALAQLIKERDSSVRIIMGGPDCAVAENGEATVREPYVDAIVHGEGEGPLVEGLAAGARPVPGALVKRGSDILSHDQPSEPVRLDSLPFPDFSVFELASYDTRHVLPLVTSRGCFAQCVFCVERVMWPSFRMRSPANVVSEMRYQEHRHRVRMFQFTDSIINGSPSHLKELCCVLGDARLSWYGNARLDAFMKPPLLHLMKDSGCHHLIYGIESGSQRVLYHMRKGYSVQTMSRVLRDTWHAGIGTEVNFIIGFPGETEQDFRTTLDFVREHSGYIDFACVVGTCSIIPGTTLETHYRSFGIEYDGTQAWRSADGTNTPAVREARLSRLLEVLEQEGITHLNGKRKTSKVTPTMSS